MTLRPPRGRMPSLVALRAFEAAARHQSFLRAAEELGVTAGAVALQVRTLEAWVGQPLFHRLAHGVRLTEHAARELPSLGEAFDALATATDRFRTLSPAHELRIAALPCIAQLWLAPRLARLKRDFAAEVQVSISALETPPHFKRDLYDFAIFYASVPPSGAEGTVLAEERIFPVCSPRLANRGAPLEHPRDLAGHTLLHDGGWKDDWSRWLSLAGTPDVSPDRGPTYSLYSIALQAAIDGGGVLMGRRNLVQAALKEGLLVSPFKLEVALDERLMLLAPTNRQRPHSPRAVIEWLQNDGPEALCPSRI
jgi:LysR family transcriptional regulator, glycine cleavage system transcriptional activator